MGTSLDEQETIIRIGRTEEKAVISTTDSRYIHKFDKLVENSPEWECTAVDYADNQVVEKFYTCPVRLVSFRTKKGQNHMTEEQRKANAERLRAYRDAQNQKNQ